MTEISKGGFRCVVLPNCGEIEIACCDETKMIALAEALGRMEHEFWFDEQENYFAQGVSAYVARLPESYICEILDIISVIRPQARRYALAYYSKTFKKVEFYEDNRYKGFTRGSEMWNECMRRIAVNTNSGDSPIVFDVIEFSNAALNEFAIKVRGYGLF